MSSKGLCLSICFAIFWTSVFVCDNISTTVICFKLFSSYSFCFIKQYCILINLKPKRLGKQFSPVITEYWASRSDFAFNCIGLSSMPIFQRRNASRYYLTTKLFCSSRRSKQLIKKSMRKMPLPLSNRPFTTFSFIS